MPGIRIVQGDITQAAVDAIVNAANSAMLGGGGVDGAIHRAAGPKLLEACRRVTPVGGVRCPTGSSRITEAGDLQARYVIHTVGPRFHIDPEPEKLLASCYRTALDLAIEHYCATIAFPAISCGAYGYPADQAAQVAIAACSSNSRQDIDIRFYLFDKTMCDLWRLALAGPT